MLGKEEGIRSFDDLLTDDGSSFPSDGIAKGSEGKKNEEGVETGGRAPGHVHKDSCILPYSSGTTGWLCHWLVRHPVVSQHYVVMSHLVMVSH